MRRTTTILLLTSSLLASLAGYSQGFNAPKAPFEFQRTGSILTVKNNVGHALATIDLDRPEMRGKVIAFTYSAKKKTTLEGSANSINIYPNPASKQVNLQLKGTWEYPIEVKILDKNGNTVAHSTLESGAQPLEVGSLKQGIYILKAQSGNATAIEKLVIQ